MLNVLNEMNIRTLHRVKDLRREISFKRQTDRARDRETERGRKWVRNWVWEGVSVRASEKMLDKIKNNVIDTYLQLRLKFTSSLP